MRTAILMQTVRALRSQWWSRERIAAAQEQALVSMMRHACAEVPFYRALGIAPHSIVGAADLQRFPIVRKKDIQLAPAAFLAERADKATLHSSRTSGSSGEPTVTWFDDASWALCKYALKIRRTMAAASPLLRRCLIVSEQTPVELEAYRRRRPFGAGLLYRERLVSLFDDLARHRREIAEFRPDMLYAFPSYLLELAQSYESPPRIPIIFTSSEMLTPRARERIESAFQAHVFDIYGSTEFKEVAWQCVHGSYHLNFESVYVEPARDEALVLSALCNRAMPLLRFDTADLGTLDGNAQCACGRQSPQLRIAMGREGDMLQLPSGRRISPYTLTTLIESLPGLHQYRIRHDAPAHLTVELAASQALSAATLEDCRHRLLEMLGEPMDVALQRVPGFDRGPGGKHRVFERR